MQRFLAVLGGCFLVILVLVAGLLLRGVALEREGKLYLDRVLPLLLSDLRQEHLLQYASPALKAVHDRDPARMAQVFRIFQRLGRFQTYGGAEVNATLAYHTAQGGNTKATYSAMAEFDHGPVKVEGEMVLLDEQWRLQLFRLDSPALATAP